MADPVLQTDERQWLVYNDEAIGAWARGLEAWALQIAGRRLAGHQLRAVNAIGHLMLRVAEGRLRAMMRSGGAQAVVVDWLNIVGTYLAAGDRAVWTPDVERAFGELHAASVRIDSRGQGAGLWGPGVHREAIRGD